MNKVSKIVSGGQTGVDRAALDVALEKGIEMGGFVPKGRLSEDGVIGAEYPGLLEAESADYSERTELNVINSDGTLIISNGGLNGGAKLTEHLANEHQKPYFHLDFAETKMESALSSVLSWLSSFECGNLNIAGPRSSEDINIYAQTKVFLNLLFD